MTKEDETFLKGYNPNRYERPSVTCDIAICSVINSVLKVLLIKRKNPPYKDQWAIPGGFVDLPARETLEETAARELYEETGLKGIFIEQLKTYGDPDRDPRMRVITVAYYALVPYNQVEDIMAGDDAAEAEWFPIRKLLIDGVTCELAFDHRTLLEDVLARLVGKVSYTPVAFNLIPKEFTWTELQMVFEAILGRKFIVPDFRKSILSKYNIKVLNKKKKVDGKGRPSNLLNLGGEKKRIF
jgi:8-oxo-dGTP diphosphatase